MSLKVQKSAADKIVIVDDLLCLINNKRKLVPDEQLKELILHNFTQDNIVQSKRLLSDQCDGALSNHYCRQKHTNRDLEEIFTWFSTCDDAGIQLPTFATTHVNILPDSSSEWLLNRIVQDVHSLKKMVNELQQQQQVKNSRTSSTSTDLIDSETQTEKETDSPASVNTARLSTGNDPSESPISSGLCSNYQISPTAPAMLGKNQRGSGGGGAQKRKRSTPNRSSTTSINSPNSLEDAVAKLRALNRPNREGNDSRADSDQPNSTNHTTAPQERPPTFSPVWPNPLLFQALYSNPAFEQYRQLMIQSYLLMSTAQQQQQQQQSAGALASASTSGSVASSLSVDVNQAPQDPGLSEEDDTKFSPSPHLMPVVKTESGSTSPLDCKGKRSESRESESDESRLSALVNDSGNFLIISIFQKEYVIAE